jgi:2-keto-4-pentenoate hydratase
VCDRAERATARAFLKARRAAVALGEYPGTAPGDLAQAYRIQDLALEEWGRPAVGWKVGRIPDPVVGQYGANRLAGPIFAVEETKGRDDPPIMPIFEGGFGAAEAEFLLRVGKAPSIADGPVTPQAAKRHVDAVHVGIEVASSPFSGINAGGPAVTISDFGNNNGLVIGPEIPDWQQVDFESWPVELQIGDRIAGTGKAADLPDGVFGAAAFLFNLLAGRGIAIRHGDWISTGAVTGVHEVEPGADVEARFGSFSSARCRIGKALPQAL